MVKPNSPGILAYQCPYDYFALWIVTEEFFASNKLTLLVTSKCFEHEDRKKEEDSVSCMLFYIFIISLNFI